MSKAAKVFRRRADAFEDLVAHVHPDWWKAQSPCEDWDARAVVAHVVMMLGEMLRPLDRALSPAQTVAENPLEAFRSARKDVEAVLDDPVLAATRTESPAGEMSAEEMIDRIVSQDIFVHCWDLAKATGQNPRMNLLDVRAVFPSVVNVPPELRPPGAFRPGAVVYGEAVEVPEGAPAQDRLLGMLGRDPRWMTRRRPGPDPARESRTSAPPP